MAKNKTSQSLAKKSAAPQFVHHGAQCDITALFRSDKLLVTFDNLASIDDRPDEGPWPPWLARHAERLNFSILGMQTHQKDWYRTAEPAEQLKELVKAGYFEQFSNILFVGASMGGFAALCFAPLVPGARVAAFSPQSTLNRQIAPFERRYKWPYRKFDWESPAYLDAAQGIGQIAGGHVFFDPFVAEDKRHAERLTRAAVEPVSIPHADHTLIRTVVKSGALDQLLQDLMDNGQISTAFWRQMRNRRADPQWARRMLKTASARGYGPLFVQACDFLEREHNHPTAARLRRRARRAARENAARIKERMANTPFWTDTLSEEQLRATLPVFVNSFNQYSYLKDTVEWFSRHGFQKVTVLDNQSTCPRLAEYFDTPDFAAKAKLVRLPENMGPRRALAEAAKDKECDRGFIFTDPDLRLPEPAAPEMVKTLFEMGLRHEFVKVGLALSLDPAIIDLDRVTYNSRTVEQVEKKYWKNSVEDGVFKATTDTTFFLYVPRGGTPKPYNDYGLKQAKIPAIRLGRKGFVAVHRPWLFQDTVDTAEMSDYFDSVNAHSTFVLAQKKSSAAITPAKDASTPPR